MHRTSEIVAPGDAVSGRARIRLEVRGIVQGVGFRPFTLRLARDLGLGGWVSNSPQGVTVEAEGDRGALSEFRRRLKSSSPPLAQISSLVAVDLEPEGEQRFEIRSSMTSGKPTTLVLPDVALCEECLREMHDPADRRYRYPFINCTHCGPRFSIITGLPYDRPNTTMAGFTLCDDCRREYEDPLDRRFHAQPVACPRCGPHLTLWDERGRAQFERDAALLAAALYLREGRIVAVKGLGGFHLMVAAGNKAAVERLRARKGREAKPLALMFQDLESVKGTCEVGPAEASLLRSSSAPIVLLYRKAGSRYDVVSEPVAHGYNTLGVMLPYTPLHHLLMDAVRMPVVATSGNRAEEPICTDEREAVLRLSGIADHFLVHNRPIARHVDDSVMQVIEEHPMMLRLGRGYAPCALSDTSPDAPATLAVGADLKNCAAQSYGAHVLTGQHVGDLEHPLALEAFTRTTEDLKRLLNQAPLQLACDLHPDYHSTRWCLKQPLPVRQIQHHHAHVVSCMVDNGLEGSVLGVSWDGTGYGPDSTIWGGEFLAATRADYSRFAHLRTFPLPGGMRAMRDGRLCALGLLYELHGADAWDAMPQRLSDTFSAEEKRVLLATLKRQVHSHRTSSAGRLFDGLAALLGVRLHSRFEGEAAAMLEVCAAAGTQQPAYALRLVQNSQGPHVVDWQPLVSAFARDDILELPAAGLARSAHVSLANGVAEVARLAGTERVVLTGGCFQNRLLIHETSKALHLAGFTVYTHHRVPPTDGGLAVGQLAAACATREQERA